jgi:YD repeat-containing protein
MIGSKDAGHQVSLACESAGRLTEETERAGLTVHLVPSMGREVHAVKDLTAVLDLSRLMKTHRFDLIHTHNSKAGFVGRLAGRLAGVPVIVHTVHGFAFHDAESAPRRFAFRELERIAARWCDGIIYISKPLEQWADRERIGRDVPHRVVYSGIDVVAFKQAGGSAVRRELQIPPQRRVVGIISKLWEGKGHEVLFKAWKTVLDEWKGTETPVLLVVGEGPLEKSLRDLAGSLGIANSIVFTNFRSDIPEITAALDIAVLPSAFEGMGRVILEAMAAGKPVVASNVGGIPDLVKEGTGILVAPGAEEPLASAISTLLADDHLRMEMGQAARNSFKDDYSSRAMVESIHAFYDFVGMRKNRR